MMIFCFLPGIRHGLQLKTKPVHTLNWSTFWSQSQYHLIHLIWCGI